MGEVYPNAGNPKLGSRWCVYTPVATSLMRALGDHVDPGVGFAHSGVEERGKPEVSDPRCNGPVDKQMWTKGSKLDST